MTRRTRRVEIRWNGGLPYRRIVYGSTVNRVTFGRARWGGEPGEQFVTTREVQYDGEPIGTIEGVRPAPGNPNRPTAFVYYPRPEYRQHLADPDRGWQQFLRLEEARRDIQRALTARTDPAETKE